MRVESWERLGLDSGRFLFLSLVVAAALLGVVLIVGEELHLGAVSFVLATVAAGCSCYLVSSSPRRKMRLAAFRQASESPSLAASSNIYLRSTGSRSKTLLNLAAEESMLGTFLADVRRMTLLGYDATSAIEASRPEDHVFSESARTVLNAVVRLDPARVDEGGEELDGILSSGGLDQETKLPLLVAVSFFLPIMLMLFAATTKQTGPVAMVALLLLEVIILDMTLALSSETVGWGA